MKRRPEVYHNKVRQGQKVDTDDETASIHDRVVFKQEGLENKLQYDHRLRTSLIDHFWDESVTLEEVANNDTLERGDFADGQYQARIRRNPGRVQVMMNRDGNAWGIPLKITKGVTLNEGSNQLEIAYMIEGLPQDRHLHFGVEFNFAGLPDGQDDRFYSDHEGNNLGQLGTTQELKEVKQLRLSDGWLGLDVSLELEHAGGIWAFPVHSVSQSESGFELVHQAVSVHPHWLIRGDQNGRWSTRIHLSLSTRSGDNKNAKDEMLAAE